MKILSAIKSAWNRLTGNGSKPEKQFQATQPVISDEEIEIRRNGKPRKNNRKATKGRQYQYVTNKETGKVKCIFHRTVQPPVRLAKAGV